MKNYGLIDSEIVLEGDKAQHVLGDCNQPMDIIMPWGHGWRAFLPGKEPQEKNGVETYACTVFGTLNAIETLGKKLFGVVFQDDFSDRAGAIMSHIGQNGADPHSTMEYLRHGGIIAESVFPFSDDIKTREQYYSPNPLPQKLLEIAKAWLTAYEFGHDWVFTGIDSFESRKNKMKGALAMSPLCASGAAWFRHADGLYYSDATPNHWFEVFDYDEGVCWYVYDSYPEDGEYIKKLDWNYSFGQCKRITLKKRIAFWSRLSGFFRGLFSEYNKIAAKNYE